MIESAIKRKMLVAWTQTTVMLAIGLALVIVPAAIVLRFGANRMIGFAMIGSEIFAIPIFITWGTRIGKLRKAERNERMEAYRMSPESHLLKLND